MTSVLDEEDVYQIAYLTLHGWDLVGNRWTKEGFTHTEIGTHGCGCCEKQTQTPYFPREAAYEAQRYPLE